MFNNGWLVATALFAAAPAGAAALPNWTVTWTNADHTAGTAANDQNALVLRVYRTAAHGGFGLGVGIKGMKVSGSGVVSAGDPETPAYLDMRGPVTGPDHDADPATNAVWKFSHLTTQCFAPNDGVSGADGQLRPAQWLTGLYTPGTLARDGWTDVFHVDAGENPRRMKEIIVDEPDFAGSIGKWGLNSAGVLTNLAFRTPKATALVEPLVHGCGGGIMTQMDRDWDLSGVKYVGKSGSTDMGANEWGPLSDTPRPGMTGALRLPSLVHIASFFGQRSSAFYQLGISSAELGLDGNLTHLGAGAFYDCASLTNVALGASPPGKTLTIASDAFHCANLRTVYFNGDRPAFTGAADSLAFGTSETAEGQITFYVRDLPSWAAVLAEADAHGGWVAAATLRTARRQKVARFTGFFKPPSVALQDPRFAARYRETATMTCEGISLGDYFAGTVTLAASCAAPDDAAEDPRRARFLRWDGVPPARERENPLTCALTSPRPIRAVFAHDWIMSDDAEPGRTMENGFWRVCCYQRDAARGWLGIGKAASIVGKGCAWPTTKERRMGGGDLNLNGDVWQRDGDAWRKWTIVACGNLACWTYDAGSYSAPKPEKVLEEGEYDKLPTRVTFPETLLWWPGELQNYDAWDNGSVRWPVREVIAICPQAVGTVSGFTVGAVSLVTRLVIRAPKLTGLGSPGSPYGLSWAGASFAETDFGEWDLTGVTNVAANAFRCSAKFQATGTLHLPNVQTVGTNAFHSLSRATGLVMGTNGLSLVKIGDAACAHLDELTDLALGAKGLALGDTLGAASVFKLPKLRRLAFPGPALPAETVDAILGEVAASDAAKQVTIYASLANGWDALADAPTADEAAAAPDAPRWGVYRKGARKAWLVHAPSAYDPRGTILVLR